MSRSKNPPTTIFPFKALLEKAGGKLIGGYYTFGEYGVVIIIEAPNDEMVMSLMLKVGSAGNVKTKTLKAFTAEEGMSSRFKLFEISIKTSNLSLSVSEGDKKAIMSECSFAV